MHFGDINVVEVTDVETFKSLFFPHGFDSDGAGMTVRSLSFMENVDFEFLHSYSFVYNKTVLFLDLHLIKL